jgi:hypothetical protein
MFVRSRTVKAGGRVYRYHSVVETIRVNGKPRQRTVYDMGKHRTLNDCIRDAERKLAYWHGEDQARHDMFAAKIGMRSEPDRVERQRAKWQAEIDLLSELAAKVGGQSDVANCPDVAASRE